MKYAKVLNGLITAIQDKPIVLSPEEADAGMTTVEVEDEAAVGRSAPKPAEPEKTEKAKAKSESETPKSHGR